MTIKLQLEQDADTPLYAQIYGQIRETILNGELPAGSRLPASRQLAQEYRLARITVTQAYDQLHAEGYVERRRGAGTFVSENLPTRPMLNSYNRRNPASPPLSPWGQRVLAQRTNGHYKNGNGHRTDVDFSFGRPLPQIFPYDVWRRVLARYLSTDDTILSRYGSPAGFTPLREAVADHLRRLRGVNCTADQVVITSGTQQALDILSRVLLVPGAEVLVETPGYIDAYDLFKVHGAKLTSMRVDDDGFPAHRLTTETKARLAFVTPANQFPHGGTMPLARRLALLQWARQVNAYIIEDDYDGELRYRGRPIATLQGLDHDERVIYLGSFSKVLFPALRLGYVVLPKALMTPFMQTKMLIDRGAPTLTQAAVTDFITEGHYERHLRRLRKAYGVRRDAMVDAMHRYLPEDLGCFVDEPAGLHVMYYINRTVDEATLVKNAAAAGVAVYGGEKYHLMRPLAPSLLLGFSGLNENQIDDGIRRLAEVIKKTAHVNGHKQPAYMR